MADQQTAFDESLADYQKQQKSFHDLREQVKKEFQEQKDQGIISEDTTIQSWLTQEVSGGKCNASCCDSKLLYGHPSEKLIFLASGFFISVLESQIGCIKIADGSKV